MRVNAKIKKSEINGIELKKKKKEKKNKDNQI